MNKKTHDVLQLLNDLVVDAMIDNDGKFGPKNQAWQDDLVAARDFLWGMDLDNQD